MAIVEMNELLSTSQAAKILGVTQRLVGRYCKEGRLGKRVAERYLITRKELEKFRKQKRGPGRPSSRKSA